MKQLLIFLLSLSGIGSVFAQNEPSQDDSKFQDKMQALYVAYITRELNLTSEDAQKFWPEHNQFDKEIKAVKTDLPELDKQQAVLNIKKKYQERFNKILGAPRTEKFFLRDGEFRKKLIERLRKMRQNRANRFPSPRRSR